MSGDPYMLTQLAGVFVASVAGSLHCVAMCGGFATAAAGGLGAPGRPAVADGTAVDRGAVRRQLSYAAGRLLGYLSLGALAGLLGAGLQLAGSTLASVQGVATWLTGVGLVVAGLWALIGPRTGLGLGEAPTGGASEELVGLDGRRGPRRGPVARARTVLARAWMRGDAWGAGLLGLSSALLPCGWLWGFVALAAGTGSALAGATLMAVFWAGSAPALAGVAWLTSGLGRKLSPHAPRIVAVAMIALGLWSLAGRAWMPSVVDTLGGEPCHGPERAEVRGDD